MASRIVAAENFGQLLSVIVTDPDKVHAVGWAYCSLLTAASRFQLDVAVVSIKAVWHRC